MRFHVPTTALAAVILGLTPATLAASEPAAIVGTWIVKDNAAPFPYHMYVFNADGTMQQANPDAGHEKTSDSDGKGVWESDGKRFRGKWVEIMADRKTHKFVGFGEIKFELTIDGDRFEGTETFGLYDASHKLIDGPHSSTFSGTRVTVR
jgi:hypothetical protein